MIKTTDVGATDWLADYPRPRSLPLDQEAQRAYARAYAVGMVIESGDNATVSMPNADGLSATSTVTSERPPPVSFTATLAALFGSFAIELLSARPVGGVFYGFDYLVHGSAHFVCPPLGKSAKGGIFTVDVTF